MFSLSNKTLVKRAIKRDGKTSQKKKKKELSHNYYYETSDKCMKEKKKKRKCIKGGQTAIANEVIGR